MKPFRVTTRCALCDYTLVTIREHAEPEEAFFARREDDAVRLAEHVQRDHPEVREWYIILRRDERG